MLNASSRFTLKAAGAFVLALVVGLAVWMGGPRVGLSPFTRNLVVALVAAAWLVAVGVAVVSRARRRARLGAPTRRTAGEATAGAEPAMDGVLGERLSRTVQWLRKSKLAESSRDVVYNLPWYLLIGAPASGKSSVVVRSGFTFSYTEPKRPQGRITVAPTDNWDIWVADEAVFIDPPGRYLFQDRAVDAWRSALEGLRAQRPSKPVDGVLLVVDVAELVALDAHGLRDRADRLRALVDATIDRFAMVLPIYVLFHKCDRLRGFAEYFDSVPENDTPLGFAFSREQFTSGQPGPHFRAEFDQLAQSIVGHRRPALGRSPESGRGAVFVFPREFALLGDRLSAFIDLVFAPNQFRRTPVLRGAYFTSAAQGGPSLDLAVNRVNAAAGIPGAHGTEPREGDRSYFLRPLFTRAIFPDRTLAGLSSDVLKRRRFTRAAALLVTTALVPMLTLPFAWGAYSDSRALVKAVEGTNQLALRAGKTAENLRLIVALKRALEPYDCAGQTPSCTVPGRRFHWGLNPGAATLGTARQAFVDATRTLFVEPYLTSSRAVGHPYDGLKTQLQAMAGVSAPAAQAAIAPEVDGPRAYLLLRTLLMLASESRADRGFLTTQMQKPWLQGVRDADDPVARELLDFYLHQLAAHHNASFAVPLGAADKPLVAAVRAKLLGVPPETYYYGMIRDEGRQKLGAIRLAAILGKDNPALLQSSAEVEGVFTRRGWDALVKDRIAQMKGDYERERSWVLGLSGQSAQAPIDEVLRTRYFADYEQAWWSFLRGITLPPLGTAESAAARLGALGDAQASPLIPLLNAVAGNTWGDAPQKGVPAVVNAAGGREPTLELAQRFQSLHDFARPAPKNDGPLAQYLQALSRLQVLIKSYLDAGRPKAQEDAIRQEVEAGLQTTNGLLRALDAQPREVVEPLLKRPFTDVLGVFKSAVPRRALSVGGTLTEDRKPLDAAAVVLLEPYQDTKFMAGKELTRSQTKAGAFTFSGPIEPGGYKVCAAKKGSDDFFCGDIRIAGETRGTTFELKRKKSLLVFGGGKLTLVVVVRYLTF